MIVDVILLQYTVFVSSVLLPNTPLKTLIVVCASNRVYMYFVGNDKQRRTAQSETGSSNPNEIWRV
jgi:hypothetical protein